MKIERRPTTELMPVPTVLVTVADGATANIITLAWTGVVCSTPPMVSIAVRPSRYSYELLRRSHDFVVNVPRASQLEAVDHCGSVSGRDVDKWADCDLHPLPATQVSAPLIAECPINLECVTRHHLALGSHDVWLAEIVATHYDDDVVDSRGRLLTEKVDPLAYAHGAYWRLGDKVGAYGFSVRQRAADAKD